MPEFIDMRGNGADAITGERVIPGERVFDTGIRNKSGSYFRNSRNRVLKEATIVWLAEQAGYTVTKRNARNSGNAKSVDGEDASVGGGKAKAGKAKAGGSAAAKQRSDGDAKD